MRAVFRALEWQVSKRITGKARDIRVFGGLKLRCYPDSPSASLVIYCDESPDYHEMHFIRRYLRPKDVFLDVGANIGVYTLLAVSQVGDEGKVLAFEPGPAALERLRENISLNSITAVSVYPCALGEVAGVADFLSSCDTTNRIRTQEDADQPVIQTQVKRLDDLVAVPCALGKMDVEGAEPLALRGAVRLLKEANPPVWLLELNGSLHAFGYTEEEFSAWLDDAGYDLGLYDADKGELSFCDPCPWKSSPNVLAVARSRRTEVAERCGATLVDM